MSDDLPSSVNKWVSPDLEIIDHWVLPMMADDEPDLLLGWRVRDRDGKVGTFEIVGEVLSKATFEDALGNVFKHPLDWGK